MLVKTILNILKLSILVSITIFYLYIGIGKTLAIILSTFQPLEKMNHKFFIMTRTHT